MSITDRVSIAIVNFQTADLTETAIRSFRAAYPDVHILVIDNGSKDESPHLIRSLAHELDLETMFLEQNRYHGPAMDLAMHRLETPFVFMLDSDTETKRGGFLESMLELCEPERVYGAGKVVQVNRRGFTVPDGIPVLVSAYMLLRRKTYLTLPPFVHHGLPALRNFEAAMSEGYQLAEFPVQDYVKHLGRGTAERFGYGLGLKSRFEYLLSRLGL